MQHISRCCIRAQKAVKAMKTQLEILRHLGDNLNKDIFPRIMNGGIVTPNDAMQPITPWAKEIKNVQQRQRRSTARPWAGNAGGQREADGPGQTSATSPLVNTDLHNLYESELTAVQQAYPSTRVWKQSEGLWLLTESILLPGLWQKAVFLTGIPYSRTHVVRSWGFWVGAPLLTPMWIGPRHTNFPDGSVCAFEPTDNTWNLGESLVGLLDIYTLWALRQLHLQVFHTWPGRQVAHFVHERITEISLGEYCGCGSNVVYRDCCRANDMARDRLLGALQYLSFGGRTLPLVLQQFIRKLEAPPRLGELLPRHKITAKGDRFLEIDLLQSAATD